MVELEFIHIILLVFIGLSVWLAQGKLAQSKIIEKKNTENARLRDELKTRDIALNNLANINGNLIKEKSKQGKATALVVQNGKGSIRKI